MKKAYYELQVYYYREARYITLFSYYGFRSNANRKFRSFLRSNLPGYKTSNFRILTYSSVDSFLNGSSPVRSSIFNP